MGSSDADAALMLRVRQGDTEAFRELVDRHQRAVINTIYRAIGDAWEAEDLAQRVFIQVYRSAKRYQETARFTTWLFTIVHHIIRNEYRRRSRHPEDSLEALQESHRQVHGLADPFRDRQTPGPDTLAAARELEARLETIVSDLPTEQRTAFILARFEGLPYEEIAKVLDCSLSATKSLLHRARLTLKEKLRGYC